MRKLIAGILTMLFLSCGNESDKTSEIDLRQPLIGEWNNLSLYVEIDTKNNSDSNEVFIVPRAEWESTLKIKPIRTFFNADSTWHAAHYNLKDSLVYDPSGKWWLSGSKLWMAQALPSADTTVYSFVIMNDTATFNATLDWDMDGKKDDNYLGTQQKRPH
jgi:hypothetical protein